MPGLLRGVVATAAVVGTATATRNAVNRHQAEKNAQAYSNAMNSTQPQQPQTVYVQAPPPQQYAPPPQEQYAPPPPPAAPAPAPSEDDVISQLERLGALKAQGIITDQEFQAQKAKLLGM